jgi:hypothetical protein
MFKSSSILGEEQLGMKRMTNLYGITSKEELSGIKCAFMIKDKFRVCIHYILLF